MTCGCIRGRFKQLIDGQEIAYIEEKGSQCEHKKHRVNHKVPLRVVFPETGVMGRSEIGPMV